MKIAKPIRFIITSTAIVVLGCVVAAVVLLGLGYAGFQMLAVISCGTEPVSTTYSPDRGWRVDTDVINCGATTDFGTQIFLRPGPHAPIWERWRGKTLVVEFDSNHGKAAHYNDERGVLTDARWSGPNHLTIAASRGARAFIKTNDVGPVKISYQVPHGVVVH